MLEQNIKKYKQKYYLNKVMKGGIFALAIMLTSFLLINAFEYFGNFGTSLRAMLFYSFVITGLMALGVWVIEPLTRVLLNDRQLSDKDAAKDIGSYFPEIQDKLLNVLQLQEVHANSSDLLQASIAQKANGMANYQFTEAIDLSYNRKYLKYLFIPFFIILGIFAFQKDFFTQSTGRIVNYNETFVPEAPFNFDLNNAELTTFKNDDFELKLKTTGSEVPASVNIITADGRKLKMSSDKTGEFSYTFKKIQKDTKFNFMASGFNSKSHEIKVFDRPSLRQFSMYVNYPNYVGKKDERVNNTGNLIVPEGTQITWNFETQATEELKIKFASDSQPILAKSNQEKGENKFEFSKKISQSDNYEVMLKNEFSGNKDAIEYYLNVVKDQSPTISLRQFEDTVMYDYLILGGNIGDDYGLTSLNMRYQIIGEGEQPSGSYETIKIPFNRDVINQSYFYKMELDSFNLQKGQKLEYFVEVYDNDGVNGRKRSKTGVFAFNIPSEEEMEEKISTSAKNAEKQMEDVLKKSKKLKKDMKDLQDKLKTKKKLDWQDKKEVKDLIESQKQLQKEIQKMQQNNEMLNQKQNKFDQMDKKTMEKAEQLQKLMDELLDEETKKLYDELQKLLDENRDKEMMEQLEKMDFKQDNLDKELERSLELFKRLKKDLKMEKLSKDLEKLGEKQEDLSEETKELAEKEKKEDGDKSDSKEDEKKDGEKADDKEAKDGEKKDGAEDKPKSEEMKKVEEKQEKLDKEFEKLEEDMKELDEMNKELENPDDLEDLDEKKEEISEQMDETQKQMQQQNKQKSSESQKKAGEKMKKMAEQMQQMQQSSESEQLSEDYDDLRQIMENLVTLSFDQEKVMKEFKTLRGRDPKFVELGQRQLKLQADAKIVEDSLVALSKRVFQIESFVTREVSAMNKYMDESIEIIKARPNGVAQRAAGKQQFAMTSMNNLALLLNDILKQMQQQMSSGMAGKQNNQKKSGGPSMGKLQQQLNKQIEQLKKSGKSGRELSESLSKMAMQQEMIRQMMKEGMGKSGGKGKGGKPGEGDPNGSEKGGKPGEDGKDGKGGEGGKTPLEELMEKTEEDLVNKRITQETINRQQEILTRLLQSEKAMRERELDNKREAKTASEKEKSSPKDFSEYLKTKEKQIELLKTIPASLNPYYKKAVNEYFKKIEK
jgi:hypothetical protein